MTASPGLEPRRLLLLRFGALGDVVLATGLIGALRRARPQLELHFATKSAWGELLEADPRLDRVHPLAPERGLVDYARELRRLAPDVLLDLHDKLRSRIVARWVGSARSGVWEKRSWGQDLPVRLGLRPYRAQLMIAERYHRAAEALLGEALGREPLEVFVSPAGRAGAEALLAARGLEPGSAPIALCPGAKWATKRWATERFAELAARAVAAGHPVLILGSPAEQVLGRAIAAAVPAVHDLTGQTGIGALAGVIARCRVLVANDSGPMHLARASRVPTVAIFGSTDPGQFDFAGHRLVFAGVPCAPCHFYGRRRCPRGHFDCMGKIAATEVWEAVEALLGTGRAPPASG